MCKNKGCNTEDKIKSPFCSEVIIRRHKTCIHEGCMVRPIYNIEGETKGLY